MNASALKKEKVWAVGGKSWVEIRVGKEPKAIKTEAVREVKEIQRVYAGDKDNPWKTKAKTVIKKIPMEQVVVIGGKCLGTINSQTFYNLVGNLPYNNMIVEITTIPQLQSLLKIVEGP